MDKPLLIDGGWVFEQLSNQLIINQLEANPIILCSVLLTLKGSKVQEIAKGKPSTIT